MPYFLNNFGNIGHIRRVHHIKRIIKVTNP